MRFTFFLVFSLKSFSKYQTREAEHKQEVHCVERTEAGLWGWLGFKGPTPVKEENSEMKFEN